MDDQPAPHRAPETVEEILIAVESVANRAAGFVSETARAVAGDKLGLEDEDAPTSAAALEHVAAELAALADRALRARTGEHDAGPGLAPCRASGCPVGCLRFGALTSPRA